MSYQKFSFRLAIPEKPEAVIFVQGIIARNFTGWRWLWGNMNTQRTSVEAAPGCVQVKGGIVGPNELMMVSWWKDNASINTFFKSPAHREMMRWVVQNPAALVLWNETYQPAESGMYLHEPHGLAKLYAHVASRPSKHADASMPETQVAG